MGKYINHEGSPLKYISADIVNKTYNVLYEAPPAVYLIVILPKSVLSAWSSSVADSAIV